MFSTTEIGSAIAGLMFIFAMFRQHFPYQLRGYVEIYSQKFIKILYPYIQITFNEYTGERLKRSDAYAAIETYLGANSSAMKVQKLKADVVKDSNSLVLSMDDHEEVTDEFEGVKLWWASGKNSRRESPFSFNPEKADKRFYKLTFHKRHQEIMVKKYINFVVSEGKEIAIKNRQRKLYTNNKTKWSHVVFEHPATFETLAMEQNKKEQIMNDLLKFSRGKEYYAKIGKAWKRGYLLYGPPGTGKSTMIAAMANYLNYDIYDLELTAVKDNSGLRKLLIETSNKSIIVIEDIDCSLDLTGQRKNKKEKMDEDEEEKNPLEKIMKREEPESKVTLSGLLNFIDGLWSACGGERILVFTTNYVDQLDPALIRRGRMDRHIELSFCCFEAFKVLAKNYLDVQSHNLFPRIEKLLEETQMTPADVAENLLPKFEIEEVESCLNSLIEALESAKEEARKKLEEETRKKLELKAEKEETEKKEEERGLSAVAEAKVEEASDKEVKENGFKEVKENGFKN